MNDPVPDSLEGLRELLKRLPPAPADIVRSLEPASGPGRRQQSGFWQLLDEPFHRDLSHQRVLVVPCGAGHDAFALARRGARHVVACEPSDAFHQAEVLESVYGTGVELRQCGWESLDPAHDGTFEVVHSNALLHLVSDPIGLLRRLRAMTASSGTLLIGALLLDDPERSELIRFVPEADAESWFVPGRLAFRWMVEAAGFEVEAEFDSVESSAARFPVSHGYLRAVAC